MAGAGAKRLEREDGENTGPLVGDAPEYRTGCRGW